MKTNILMVCLGNICRSPLAEGILKSKLPESTFLIDSAGTANYHVGNPPDRRSIAVGKKYGIDISKQKARQFQVEDFDEFDILFVMDAANYRSLQQKARNENDKKKIKLILNECYPQQNRAVPDPYWNDDGFELVYQLLDDACEAFVQKNS